MLWQNRRDRHECFPTHHKHEIVGQLTEDFSCEKCLSGVCGYTKSVGKPYVDETMPALLVDPLTPFADHTNRGHTLCPARKARDPLPIL